MNYKHLLALTLALVLTSCAPAITTSNTTEHNQSLPREEPTPTYHAEQHPEDGLERWRSQEQNAVVILVNDGAVAVRAFLKEQEEVTLELQETTTIHVQQVHEHQATLLVNNHSLTLQEQKEATVGLVTIHLTETTVASLAGRYE